MKYPFPQCPEYPSMNVSIPGCFQFLKTSSVPFVDWTESILTPFLPRLFIIIFSISLIPLYLNGSLWYFISLLNFAVKLLFLSPVSFCYRLFSLQGYIISSSVIGWWWGRMATYTLPIWQLRTAGMTTPAMSSTWQRAPFWPRNPSLSLSALVSFALANLI